MKSNFDKFPNVSIKGHHCTTGWKTIADTLQNVIRKKSTGKTIVAVECYHGVYTNEVGAALKQHFPEALIIDASVAIKSIDGVGQMVYPFVTDDPVFGYMAPLSLEDFFDADVIVSTQNKIESHKNEIVIVYGIGSSLIADNAAVLVYADMPRWEIQLRLRNNSITNIGADNAYAEFAYQYKRSFFVDW